MRGMMTILCIVWVGGEVGVLDDVSQEENLGFGVAGAHCFL